MNDETKHIYQGTLKDSEIPSKARSKTSSFIIHHSSLLVVLVILMLAAQARLLYVFPQPDSARWWGDETGQMLELLSLIHISEPTRQAEISYAVFCLKK